MDEIFETPPPSPVPPPSTSPVPPPPTSPESPPPPPPSPPTLYPLQTPPPPPLPRRQPIIIFSQRNNPDKFQLNRYFYDPHHLYNEHAFTLEGDTEYIILIQCIGYEQNDNHIYSASINIPNGPLQVNPEDEPQSICLLIRHLGPAVNLSVAPHTSLAFLLENARLSVRLCYISDVAEFCLFNDQAAIVTEAMAPPRSSFLTTYSPYLKTTSTIAQQTASRHPLLLRRLLNLPKPVPSPLATIHNE
jgi:hypothetical protein